MIVKVFEGTTPAGIAWTGYFAGLGLCSLAALGASFTAFLVVLGCGLMFGAMIYAMVTSL